MSPFVFSGTNLTSRPTSSPASAVRNEMKEPPRRPVAVLVFTCCAIIAYVAVYSGLRLAKVLVRQQYLHLSHPSAPKGLSANHYPGVDYIEVTTYVTEIGCGKEFGLPRHPLEIPVQGMFMPLGRIEILIRGYEPYVTQVCGYTIGEETPEGRFDRERGLATYP